MNYAMYLGSATRHFQPLGTLTRDFQPLGTLIRDFQPLGTLTSDFQPLGTHYFDDSHHYFSDALISITKLVIKLNLE